jgi:hypothetical protein
MHVKYHFKDVTYGFIVLLAMLSFGRGQRTLLLLAWDFLHCARTTYMVCSDSRSEL